MMNPHEADSAVGQRLKQAREAAGHSLADISARSRMPVRVLETLESGQWAALGAPVFVRGQVRSYARVLGLTLDDQALPSPLTTAQIPSLVSHSHVPRYRHVAENMGRRAIYIVLTVALVVPVWLATRGQLSAHGPAVQPLDLPATGAAVGAVDGTPVPMVASIAALPPKASSPASAVLEFGGDSWLQLFDARGREIERGVARAGDRRDLVRLGAVRVVLGNASAAQLRQGAALADLGPYSQANVARFTLSSDGSLAPIAPAGP